MPSLYAAVTDPLQARTSSEQNGQNSSPSYGNSVCSPHSNVCIHTNRSPAKITELQALTHSHLKIVGLVGSIDNDMSMTDLTIGAPTALHRICEAIDNINSTAFSHSRAFVLEVMGRHCGWLALLAGVAGGADFIFIPERPPQAMPWEDEMCNAIHRVRCVPSLYRHYLTRGDL